MDNEGYQKELFDFDGKQRKPFPGFEKILPKADFEGKVSITLGLEKVVFISIGIILTLVVIFAIGVERGKSITLDAVIVPAKTTPAVYMPAPIAHTVPQIKPEPDDISVKPYTIIAMTFKEQETAAQAVNWLKKEGFPAYQKQDGQFFPICIGAYANKFTATETLLKVKRLCKDAYIKTRQ